MPIKKKGIDQDMIKLIHIYVISANSFLENLLFNFFYHLYVKAFFHFILTWSNILFYTSIQYPFFVKMNVNFDEELWLIYE